MEILFALAGLFFMLLVPWAAISGAMRARAAERMIGELRAELALLRGEMGELNLRVGRLAASGAPAPNEAAGEAAASAQPAMESSAEVESATLTADAASALQAVPGLAPETAPEALAAPETVTAPSAGTEEAAAPEPRPPRDIEETLGARWTVWIGALALGLGGVFLVRYSIEAGFFGPRARLALAALFGLGLLALGEAARRGLFSLNRAPALPSEHVPLALTAAGVATLFGVVYATYAVYGFIGPAAAFALLAFVAGAALAASLLHGQALAGAGLIGGYATPALVGGDAKSLWPLALYLVALGASALALNLRFRAVWMTFATLAGAAGWTLLLAGSAGPDAGPLLFLALASLVSFLAALSWLQPPAPPARPWGDEVALICVTALAMLLGLAFLRPDMPIGPAASAALAAMALLGASALRDPRIVFGLPLAVVLGLGTLLTWPSLQGGEHWFLRVVEGWRLAPSALPRSSGILILFAAAGMALVFAAAALGAMRPLARAVPQGAVGRMILSFAGGLGSPLLMLAACVRIGGLAQDLRVAALFVLLAALSAGVAVRLLRREGAEADGHDSTGFAAGTALAAGLAIAFALPGLWMAVGFAAAAALTAWIAARQPMPGLRACAGSFVTAAMVRAATAPTLPPADAWPFFNELLPALGLPFALCGAAAALLRRGGADRAYRAALLGAVVFAIALTLLQIAHAFGSDARFVHGEFHASWVVALCATPFIMAGLWLRRRGGGGPAKLAVAAGVVMLLGGGGLGLLVLNNPFLDGSPVWGWLILNRLAAGCAAALLAAWLSGNLLRETNPRTAQILHLLAAALGALLIVSQIRLVFHGADLVDSWRIGLAEAGCYVLWLIALAALSLLASDDTSPLRRLIESGANAGALAAALALAVVIANPLLGAQMWSYGPLDESLVGFLATGAGFALLAYLGRLYPSPHRDGLITVDRWAAIGLGYLYLLTQIRRSFVGVEHMVWAPFSDGEHYALSLGTLLYGAALLLAGMKLASREVRFASALFVGVAVVKVFLYDMAGLSGLWRPVSFIGLGAVLIGIGTLYQRVLFRRPEGAAAAGS